MPGFQLAHPKGVGVPRVVQRPLAAAQAFLSGAVLLVDANGAYAECGADPAAVAAISLSGCGADASGFNILAKKEFPPGYMQAIPITTDIQWIVPYVGTLPAADGGSYGIVKDSDNFWKADFSDTTNLRIKLVGRRTTSPENLALVEVVFLSTNIQLI